MCVCYGQEDEKCETGLIEAMAKSSTTSAAKIISVPITLLLTLRKSTKFSYINLLETVTKKFDPSSDLCSL